MSLHRLCILCCLLVGLGCSQKKNAPTIKIIWAEWPPSDALASLADLYTQQSGVPVQVVKKSWDGAFTAAVFSEFRNRDDNYDILIGDSQWLGLGAAGGHYLELTEWLPQHIPVDQIAPSALKWYCEYPKGSKRFFAVPCEGDALAFAYRKDLFEDLGHQSAFAQFLTRHNIPQFPLAPPATWEHLEWIARYFKESSPGFSGIVMPTSRSYDMATMSFEQILWSMGGEFGNYETNEVLFNSSATVRALTFFNRLLDYSSAGGRNMGYGGVLGEFTAGRTAMICNYYALMTSLLSPLDNPDFYDKIGFFNSPASVDSLGNSRRVASLGGQGMSVNAHIALERQQAALEFLKWFSSTEVQRLWAAKGGFTVNLGVMRSTEFLQAKPYYPLFEEAFGMMQDFWTVPEFDQLLAVTQRELCNMLQNLAKPEEVAVRIHTEHVRILQHRNPNQMRAP